MSYFEVQPNDMRHGYYEDEDISGRIMRHPQSYPENYDNQIFYTTQPGRIAYKYGGKQKPIMDQYDDINEGYYYTTDFRNERRNPMHNNFVTASPNMHMGNVRRPSNKNQNSPYVMVGNFDYHPSKERPEYFEQNKRSKYSR